ncbi:MAG: HTH domain-containing protein, partial [Lachnospiraceae bacterium]|nr:HTH domain-containing protein [Lachnospiraceae bacterium]
TVISVSLVIAEITGIIRSEVKDMTRRDIYSEEVSLQQEEEKNRRILCGLTTEFRCTPRETDVVRIILREKDIRTNEIAEEMQISRTMVYRYINSLLPFFIFITRDPFYRLYIQSIIERKSVDR